MIQPELTVATVVARDDRFLMVEEHIDQQVRFNQPAGHVEPGERIVDAAVRETREETAWQVTLQALLGIYYWPATASGAHILRCAFSARADVHVPDQPLDDDITTLHWLTRDEIAARAAQLRSPLVLASIDAWCAGVHLPLSSIHHVT